MRKVAAVTLIALTGCAGISRIHEVQVGMPRQMAETHVGQAVTRFDRGNTQIYEYRLYSHPRSFIGLTLATVGIAALFSDYFKTSCYVEYDKASEVRFSHCPAYPLESWEGDARAVAKELK